MIYFIECVGTPFVKVGFATSNADFRLKDLQVGNPLELRLVAVIAGSRSDEKAIHRTLRHFRQRGEWFSRPEAMQLLRAVRRVGLVAIPNFARWRENEAHAERRRTELKDRGFARGVQQLAHHVLKTIPADKIKGTTGLSRRAWAKNASGESILTAQNLVNSIRYSPRHFSRLVRFKTGLRLTPIADADRIRGGS